MNPLVNRLIFKSRKNTGITTSVIDIKGTIDISGNILPSTTLTYDLGSSTQRWRDIYLSGNTIDLGGTKITKDVSSGGIKITDVSGTTLGATFQDISVNNLNLTGNIYQNGTLFTGGGGSSQWTTSGSKIYYNTGNVGIGSGNPAYNLDVSGNLNVKGNIYQNGSPYIGSQWITNSSKIYYNTGNVGIGSINPAYNLDVSGNLNIKGNIYQNGTLFTGGGSSQWTTSGSKIYYNTGNVGIGSGNPAYNLDVSGNISLTGNIYQNGTLFSTSDWLKYVFSSSSSYALGWGSNNIGQTTIPTEGLSNVISVSAGSMLSVILRSNGSVTAWGANGNGQATVPISAQSGIIAIDAGFYHVLALKNTGQVIAWGDNYENQIDVPIGAQSNIIAVSASEGHSLALTNTGSVIGWGSNYAGEIDIIMNAQSNVIAISAGSYYSLALKSNGEVIGWGGNYYGQTTIPIGAQSGVIAISAGRNHALALKNNGQVIGWGSNSYGETTIPSEAQSGIIAISAGTNYSLAVKSNGSVIGWGNNNSGEITIPSGALSNITAISAGDGHVLALYSNNISINNTYNTTSNIGIGTNYPIQKLDVLGNSYFRGNVGIGNSNPAYNLDVSGNLNVKGNIYQNGSTYIGSQWITSGSKIYYNTDNVGIGTNYPIQALDVSGNAYFRGNTTFVGNVTTNGNVGIGTNPFAPLHVSPGTVRFISTATAGSTGDLQYNGISFLGTPIGTQTGIVPSMQYYVLNTTRTVASLPDSIFGVGVTLSSNTRYMFETFFIITKSGTITSTLTLYFSGGTLGCLTYNGTFCMPGSVLTVPFNNNSSASNPLFGVSTSPGTAFTVNAAVVNSACSWVVTLTGFLDVTVGATVTPTFNIISSSGTVQVLRGSYISFYPVSSASANTSIGTWA